MQRTTITLDDDLMAPLDGFMTERGVRHGRLLIVPVEEQTESHSHRDALLPHSRLHVRRRI